MPLAKEKIKELEALCIDFRKSILKLTHKAKSGHPGGSLSVVEILTVLYFGVLKYDPKNPSRSEQSSNPFTYFERYLMIRDSMLDAGINRGEFEIIPFPINYPERIKYYAPLNARYFITKYDDGWGDD